MTSYMIVDSLNFRDTMNAVRYLMMHNKILPVDNTLQKIEDFTSMEDGVPSYCSRIAERKFSLETVRSTWLT